MPSNRDSINNSVLYGNGYYGHRTNFSQGEENVNGGLDNHYYNTIVLKDNLLRISVKVVLGTILIYLIIKYFS